MLFKFKKTVGCIEPWVKNRDTNRILCWCIVTALEGTLPVFMTTTSEDVKKRKGRSHLAT